MPIAHTAIEDGLRAVRWPGRFEILHRHPFLVVDGAHNRDSAQKLMTALADYFPRRRVQLLFGASSDKDVAGMFAELLAGQTVTRAIMAQAVHPRAIEPDELAQLARQARPDLPVETIAPVARALDHALRSAAPDEVLVACGSLFVVAEVQTAWRERERLEIRD